MIDIKYIEASVRKLKELKQQEEALSKKIKRIEDEIKTVMTAYSVYEFEGDDWRVSWKMVSSSRFDQSIFKSAHPKLFEKYKVLSESRRFLLK